MISEDLVKIKLKSGRLGEKYIKKYVGQDKVFSGSSSLSTFKILSVLEENKKVGVTYRELLKETQLAKSTLSIALGKAVDNGLFTKEPLPCDVLKIHITDKGSKYADINRKVSKELDNVMLSNLSKRDREVFERCIKTILETLEEL